jgi:hypothetical protein
MIVDWIVEQFERIGHTWTVGGKTVQPTADDVQKTLDEAVRMLYTRPSGQQLEVGGIIVEKRPHGHDVWVYLGNYK